MSYLCPHCREYDIPDDSDTELPVDKEEEYKEIIVLLKMEVDDCNSVIEYINKEYQKLLEKLNEH